MVIPLQPEPPLAPARPPVPRIGGTAMPGGVHFSSGNYGTGPNYLLFLTGVSIITLGALALALAYVLIWFAGRALGLPLTEALMGLAGGRDLPYGPLVHIAMNLVVFFCFLIVLRLSPLSGYHGAEHKVVHCLETYGVVEEHLAWASPRAHKRCGTTLLAGILPLPFIALPLLSVPVRGLPAALAVLVLGWLGRFTVGALVQQVFTTKEPSRRQMAAALGAAEKLLAQWRRDPYRRVPWWQGLWVRGFPQMIAGVLVVTQFLDWLQTRLPFWLDFGGILH